jgi:hypothetical protein
MDDENNKDILNAYRKIVGLVNYYNIPECQDAMDKLRPIIEAHLNDEPPVCIYCKGQVEKHLSCDSCRSVDRE